MTVLRPLSVLTGSLPRPFWVMWWGTLVNRLCGFVVPFLTLFLTAERELTPVQATVVVGALGLGGFFAQLVGGVLADRLGRRRVMLLALTLSPPFLLGLGFAPGLTLTLPCAFVFALIGEMYRPAANAAVADLVPPGERLGTRASKTLRRLSRNRKPLWLESMDGSGPLS